MTAPVAVSQHAKGAVRTRLLAEADGHAATLARCRAAIATATPENTTALDRAMAAVHMYRAYEAIEEIEAALARVAGDIYGLCLACSRPIPLDRLATIPQARFCAACPPPAPPAVDGSARPRLGSGRGERTGPPPPVRSLQTPEVSGREDAAAAVRRLVDLARQLLSADTRGDARSGRLDRVARLRDELHVTANRVVRFADDEEPFLDPVRVTASTAATAVLAPAQLLFRLDLTTDRLVGHLDALSAADWARTARMGDRIVTLAALVEEVVDTSAREMLELMESPTEVALLEDGAARRNRRDSASPRPSGPRDATAW